MIDNLKVIAYFSRNITRIIFVFEPLELCVLSGKCLRRQCTEFCQGGSQSFDRKTDENVKQSSQAIYFGRLNNRQNPVKLADIIFAL